MAPPEQRKAHKIIDRVYLGPQQVAHDQKRLDELSITCVMSVLDENQHHDKVVITDQNKRHWVKIADTVDAEQEMKEKLPEALATLFKWHDAGETILVHCQSGISRSATVMIAFHMIKLKIPLMVAYGKVWEARHVINPNDGFFRSLQDLAQKHRLEDMGSWDPNKPQKDYLPENQSAPSNNVTHYPEFDEKLADPGQVERVLQAAANKPIPNTDEEWKSATKKEYNAYQLVSQLAFTKTTLQQCKDKLKEANGNVEVAASLILQSTNS